MTARGGEAGQAFPLVVLLGAFLLAGGAGLFLLGRAHAAKAQAQAAADLTALSAGRRLRHVLPLLATAAPARRAAWRADLRMAADGIARGNHVRLVRVTWPDGNRWPPTRIQVTVAAEGPAGVEVLAGARAAIAPGGGALPEEVAPAGGGQYAGPLVYRDGKPTCPVVAAAFDRMAAAARADGVRLTVTSGFRPDAEQAILFARHPDPKWVAPPGRSRHRYATELDIAGGPGAWSWLGARAGAFGFTQRYSWEPWHYGYLPGCGAGTKDLPTSPPGGLPAWVPVRYRGLVLDAARAGGIPPVILAALLQAESGFDPAAVSAVGAVGIAQFMPATARGIGLRNPFDPAQAIPAAGRLLGAHLRAFGAIPLALAAYNAGPGAVTRYGGIPPYAETRAYVSRIMALAGDPTIGGPSAAGGGGVTLVRMGELLA